MRTRSESTGRLHTALIEANEEIEKENEESKITNREINDRLTKIEVMQKALRHVERDSKTGL